MHPGHATGRTLKMVSLRCRTLRSLSIYTPSYPLPRSAMEPLPVPREDTFYHPRSQRSPGALACGDRANDCGCSERRNFHQCCGCDYAFMFLEPQTTCGCLCHRNRCCCLSPCGRRGGCPYNCHRYDPSEANGTDSDDDSSDSDSNGPPTHLDPQLRWSQFFPMT